MPATLAALALVLLSQVSPPPKEVTPGEKPAEETAPARPADSEAPPANPPPPSKRAVSAPPARARQLSLLSGESLGGGSASLAWVGWSSLGIMYGQGITAQDDIAALADFDWAYTELRLGGFYRRPLGQAGDYDVAGRLAVTWYKDLGATWVRGGNHSDHGFELAPGVSLSTRAGGGIFSAIAEAPLTVTLKYGAGLLFSPRLSAAFEAPLYPELTLGARLGIGYRAGSGDAPLKEGRAQLLFQIVAGYQVL
ncbi:MAG TPA: hypothetical protein VIW03_05310 [Anaeromyxobacter sp.]